MKEYPATLVELPDASCWVRLGGKMLRIDDLSWLLEQPTQTVTGVFPLAKIELATESTFGADPAVEAELQTTAPVKTDRRGGRVSAEKRAKYEEIRATGMKVAKAAREAGIDPMTAYGWERKKKAAKPAGVKRRCDDCQAITLTDPCGNCGAAWARKKVSR
jgi:hypothetical protein